MRVYDIGGDDPSYAVVACLHGDEPCGLRAVEYVREHRRPLAEPLRLVVANERAVEAGVRAVETDLNRVFPGDPDGDSYESRLAAEVLDAVAGRTVLDLHSTVSAAEPFVVIGTATDRTLELAAATGTDHVVEASYLGGGLLAHVDGVAVECGYKGTDAAAGNAIRVLARFLAAVDLLDEPADLVESGVPPAEPGHELPDRATTGPPTVYRIVGETGRAGDEFRGENFGHVAAGETFAVRDGEPVIAAESFYPVLMSTDGYDDKLGFRAQRVGRLPEVDAGTLSDRVHVRERTTAGDE